jgi:hypothetical protein
MRALLSMVAAIAVALALDGCPSRQQQPLPGPKSSTASGRMPHSTPAVSASPQERDSPDEINWFQGTLEEAFSRRPRTDDRPLFRY